MLAVVGKAHGQRLCDLRGLSSQRILLLEHREQCFALTPGNKPSDLVMLIKWYQETAKAPVSIQSTTRTYTDFDKSKDFSAP